jgi:hypothetical protein
MRQEHGVLRDNIDGWVDEFTFWKRYVAGRSLKEVSSIYIELLKNLLNK